MSEMIPDDIIEAVENGFIAEDVTAKTRMELLKLTGVAGRLVLAERNRCISIAQSIDPHNEAEAHLIETIVRRIRGDE